MTSIETTMYTLGQLARAVHPNGDIPAATLDQLLVYPIRGIALLTKRPNSSADVARIINKLPADMPAGPIKIEHQGPFWFGWYHYLAALDRAKRLGPDHLERAGKVLFGDRWQTDLGRAINVADRTVRAWVAGDRRPSAGVWADIAALLRQRSNEGIALLCELDHP